MISSDALQLIDSTILTLAGIFALCSLVGGFYAVPWSRCSPSESASKEYNKLWTVRFCLQVTATAWLLCPFLQLYENWSSYLPALHSSVMTQGKLCRIYVVLRVGLLEPFFLLLSLLTFRQFLSATESCLPSWKYLSSNMSRRSDKKQQQPRNSRIILRAGICASVVCLIPLVIAALKQNDVQVVEANLHLPRSTLMTYHDSNVCWRDHHIPSTTCTACVLPLISTFISTAVVGFYLYQSWRITIRMGQLAINQYIEKRMRLFRSSVCVLLFFSLLFRGLSVIREPGHVLHEFCKLIDFLSMFLFMMALNFILVIRPIREARIADKNAKSVTITLW